MRIPRLFHGLLMVFLLSKRLTGNKPENPLRLQKDILKPSKYGKYERRILAGKQHGSDAGSGHSRAGARSGIDQDQVIDDLRQRHSRHLSRTSGQRSRGISK